MEQLSLMVMQAGLDLLRADTLAYAGSVIDVVVQLDGRTGKRAVADILREDARAERQTDKFTS